MKIFRVFRIAALDLPASAVVDAVVIAPTADLARGLVATEEVDRELAREWLFASNSKVLVIELGEASQEYMDGHVNGDDDPHLVTVERKL